MKHTKSGWVVINENHPNNRGKFIVNSTFESTRSKAVKNFIEGTSKSWNFWKKKWNFSVVRAVQTITTVKK